MEEQFIDLCDSDEESEHKMKCGETVGDTDGKAIEAKSICAYDWPIAKGKRLNFKFIVAEQVEKYLNVKPGWLSVFPTVEYRRMDDQERQYLINSNKIDASLLEPHACKADEVYDEIYKHSKGLYEIYAQNTQNKQCDNQNFFGTKKPKSVKKRNSSKSKADAVVKVVKFETEAVNKKIDDAIQNLREREQLYEEVKKMVDERNKILETSLEKTTLVYENKRNALQMQIQGIGRLDAEHHKQLSILEDMENRKLSLEKLANDLMKKKLRYES